MKALFDNESDSAPVSVGRGYFRSFAVNWTSLRDESILNADLKKERKKPRKATTHTDHYFSMFLRVFFFFSKVIFADRFVLLAESHEE